MSNIERKYAYYDEGVLPAEGEYGITYLTLYSSGSGNVYDGWIYDPEDKIPVSATERTFGFRNPDYPQYCWDDEVVVDLSNAQSREESSEFAQGRITSFNTNVSSRPIVLQDVDISGLTESEREAKATTVLFCAIPLVEDAYIQAEVEVQCKVNLSSDNTTGMVRIEAFYILNDESDRTMRPNPVHTFAVSTANERHTLPWLYWNPALKHEDHNYIGVKLICTGGTAEIGISDDPEYGDAIITLTSAGLTGDKIDPGKPVYIELFGLEEVPMNYHFKPSDYTVLCTYDTGEIYDVTNMSAFSMEIGEKFVEPVTLLQATYCGLHASMNVRLGMIDYIEIQGVDTFYDSYTLDIKDFTVLAYLDSGDVYDITAECTFSPAMGTTITANTTLTATFVDDHSSTVLTFTDSMDIEKIVAVVTVPSRWGNDYGLTYTLYDDNTIIITGDANILEDNTYSPGDAYHDYVDIPDDISIELNRRQATGKLVWDAKGEICGIELGGYPEITEISGFESVSFKPHYINHSGDTPRYNKIWFNFSGNSHITSEQLSFLSNIEYDPGKMKDVPIIIASDRDHTDPTWYGMFYETNITNVDFIRTWDSTGVKNFNRMFYNCKNLNNITGLKGLKTSDVETAEYMFFGCEKLESGHDLSLWKLPKLYNVKYMFSRSGLKNLAGIGEWDDIGINISQDYVYCDFMFAWTKINDLIGLNPNFFNSKMTKLPNFFYNCSNLKSLKGGEHLDMSNVEDFSNFFASCSLEDISGAANWNVENVITMNYMFYGNYKIETFEPLNTWNPVSCRNFIGMFATRVAIPFESGSILQWPNATKTIDTLWQDYSGSYSPGEHIWISIVDESTWKNILPPPHGLYYVTHGGMCSGTDVFDMKTYHDGSGTHIEYFAFVNILSLPVWYRDLLKSDIYRRYNN